MCLPRWPSRLVILGSRPGLQDPWGSRAAPLQALSPAPALFSPAVGASVPLGDPVNGLLQAGSSPPPPAGERRSRLLPHCSLSGRQEEKGSRAPLSGRPEGGEGLRAVEV